MLSSRFMSAILRAPEGDPSGGGGGGKGDGDGKGDPPAEPFNEAQYKALGDQLNGALTNRVPKMVSSGVTEALKVMDWKAILTPLVAELAPRPAPGDDDTKKKPKDGPAIDPETQRTLQKLADDLEKEKKARLEAIEEAKRIKSEHEFGAARQRLYEGLKPHAQESLHDVWVDHLIHHRRLQVEDGVPKLEVEFLPFRGAPKKDRQFLALEEAIPHLVASEEAKRFLPVPDAGDGRGNPGPRGRKGSSQIDPKDPIARARARLEAMGIDLDKETTS